MITIYTQAYNVEPYIEQCIKSVISQTYHDFEWLLIENGSLDGTRDVIRKYAQLDDRIKVEYFDKNRTGFANDYIQEKAKGEYIVKLDSDDWIGPDYLRKLLDLMEKKKVDISICGAVDYEEETGEKFPHEYGLLNGIYQTTDIRENYIELRSYLGTYWGKMFKKDIFCKVLPKMKVVDKKLEQGSYFGGDTAFMLCYLMECKKMAFINERMYFYRIHGGGSASCTMGINRISSYFIAGFQQHHIPQLFRQLLAESCHIFRALIQGIDFFQCIAQPILQDIFQNPKQRCSTRYTSCLRNGFRRNRSLGNCCTLV